MHIELLHCNRDLLWIQYRKESSQKIKYLKKSKSSVCGHMDEGGQRPAKRHPSEIRKQINAARSNN